MYPPDSLEDEFPDILGKAQRGYGLTDGEIASAVEATESAYRTLRRGQLDEGLLRRVAPVLHLDADSLLAIARGETYPRVALPAAITRVIHPFGETSVNVWIVRPGEDGPLLIFDAGTQEDVLRDAVRATGATSATFCLTHADGDHLRGLPALEELFPDLAKYAPEGEPIPGARLLQDGEEITVAGMTIRALGTPGHSPGHLAFAVEGLGAPVAIVGDALFAGSVGGGRVSLTSLLDRVREKILSLPEETILLPGHGPATTVGTEKRGNPFFA